MGMFVHVCQKMADGADRLRMMLIEHLRNSFPQTTPETEVEVRLGRMLWIEKGGSATSPDTVRVAEKFLGTGGEQWRVPYALDTNAQIVFDPSIPVPSFAAINNMLNKEVVAQRATLSISDDVLGYYRNPIAPERDARMLWSRNRRLENMIYSAEDKVRWARGTKNIVFPGAPWDLRLAFAEEIRTERLRSQTATLIRTKRMEYKFMRARARQSYVLTAIAPQIKIDITCVMNYSKPGDVEDLPKMTSCEHTVELELVRLPGHGFEPDLAEFYTRQIEACVNILRIVEDVDVDIKPLDNTYGNPIAIVAMRETPDDE